jgi:CshA-type fibril repeat protein
VRFLPEPAFRGTTSAVRLTRSAVTSKLQIEVTAVDPIATDDAVTTSPGDPVQVAVLANDEPGATSRPLVLGSVRLKVAGASTGGSVSAEGQILTVPGRGTFAVAGDGTITFYPLPVVTGVVPRVGYQVLDVNGSTASATVSVRVA